MPIQVIKTDLHEIKDMRVVFLHDGNFQFTYDKAHYYGWADTYVFLLDGQKVGYGSVWGKDKREDRDSIFEFFLIKPHRKQANAFFPEFIIASGASYIECQSNDDLLTSMLYEYATDIGAEAILFKDHAQTHFVVDGATLERNLPESNERNRQYLMKVGDTLVANGGMIMNYNIPYVDIYYDVLEEHRRKGYASFFVQELKKEAYSIDRVPAARCNVHNQPSKATLLKSGFVICGHRLYGLILKPEKK
jgi:GNAT superfamily N-acetyltransferase